jgi:hypothetical protein
LLALIVMSRIVPPGAAERKPGARIATPCVHGSHATTGHKLLYLFISTP